MLAIPSQTLENERKGTWSTESHLTKERPGLLGSDGQRDRWPDFSPLDPSFQSFGAGEVEAALGEEGVVHSAQPWYSPYSVQGTRERGHVRHNCEMERKPPLGKNKTQPRKLGTVPLLTPSSR